MKSYKILSGAYYDRANNKMVEVGDVVEFTKKQALAYGLSYLKDLSVTEDQDQKPADEDIDPAKDDGSGAGVNPESGVLEAILDDIKALPAAEAVEKYNAIEGVKPVTSKVAAINALEAMIAK